MRLERGLFAEGHQFVGGIDEVGRGAWAGPLVVAIVVMAASSPRLPAGVRDSKELSPRARSALAPELRTWCAAWSLGVTGPGEIDRLGMSRALTVAARRALGGLGAVAPDALIVDGPTNFVEADARDVRSERADHSGVPRHSLRVITRVGADATCGTVAAASIIAKVARDGLMDDLARGVPHYGFERHKGYGTSEHEAAIARHGLTPFHRRSWSFVDRLRADTA
jgi:ribonuclease HII